MLTRNDKRLSSITQIRQNKERRKDESIKKVEVGGVEGEGSRVSGGREKQKALLGGRGQLVEAFMVHFWKATLKVD